MLLALFCMIGFASIIKGKMMKPTLEEREIAPVRTLHTMRRSQAELLGRDDPEQEMLDYLFQAGHSEYYE